LKKIKLLSVVLCACLIITSCIKDRNTTDPDTGGSTVVPDNKVFKLVSPENKAEDISVDVRLLWIHEKGCVYDVFLGKSIDKLINVTIDKNKNDFYPKNLKSETSYYWKVIATNPVTKESKESPIYAFKTFSNVATQPEGIKPLEELDNIIGFWDFDKDGKNNISNHSADWNIKQQLMLKDGSLVIDKSYKTSWLSVYDLSVNLWNHKTSGYDKGLASRRYFSGAIRFKINEYQNSNSLFVFGVTSRWLDIFLDQNYKLAINVAYGKVAKLTDITVARDQWHVLYFRYEVFQDHEDYKNDGENRFYLQLDDNKEELIHFGEYELQNLAKESDIFLSFINTADATHMIGEIDWCIMARGRMTPSTVQYRLKSLR
jgi:hypothetical protein